MHAYTHRKNTNKTHIITLLMLCDQAKFCRKRITAFKLTEMSYKQNKVKMYMYMWYMTVIPSRKFHTAVHNSEAV